MRCVRRPQGRPPPPPAAVRRARFAPAVADPVPGSGTEAAEATGRPPPHPSAGRPNANGPSSNTPYGVELSLEDTWSGHQASHVLSEVYGRNVIMIRRDTARRLVRIYSKIPDDVIFMLRQTPLQAAFEHGS